MAEPEKKTCCVNLQILDACNFSGQFQLASYKGTTAMAAKCSNFLYKRFA